MHEKANYRVTKVNKPSSRVTLPHSYKTMHGNFEDKRFELNSKCFLEVTVVF